MEAADPPHGGRKSIDKSGNFSPTVAEGGGEGEKKREKRRRKRGKVVKGV